MEAEAVTSLKQVTPHQIDPDGDLILFTPGRSIDQAESATDSHFLVSSKHLKLASSYFKSLLSETWSHGKSLATEGTAQVAINDCKPGILLLILNIVHGRTRRIPKKITFEQLVDFSLATDFFQCHEAVEVLALMWIGSLKTTVPLNFCSDTKRWMMIASVFNVADVLKNTTEIAMKEGTGPFLTDGLPIPASVKNNIDNTRTTHLQKIQRAVEERIGCLMSGSDICSHQCDATYLGLLLKKLAQNHILLQPILPQQWQLTLTSITLGSRSVLEIISLVLEKMPVSTVCSRRSYSSCKNENHPWGLTAANYASTLQKQLQNTNGSNPTFISFRTTL